MHENQQSVHSQHADRRHDHRDHGGKNGCIANCLPHLIHSSCPKFLGGKYGKSCGQSHQKTNDQKGDGTCGSYRRQSLGTYKLSYYNRIRHTVKLLKYITDKNRNGEIQQHFHGLSHSHICLHFKFSSIRKNIV